MMTDDLTIAQPRCGQHGAALACPTGKEYQR